MLGDRVRNMEAEGQDEYEVRQQVRCADADAVTAGRDWAKADPFGPRSQKRVHADSLQMIPDSEKRLAKAIEELQELVVRSVAMRTRENLSLTCLSLFVLGTQGQNEDLAGMEELAKAKAALEAAVDASA